jgi:hypothetical protein
MRTAQLRGSPRNMAREGGARAGGRGADRAAQIMEAELRELRFRSNGNAALAAAPEPDLPEPAQEPAKRQRLRLAPPIPVRVPRTPFVVFVVLVVIAGVLGILVLNNKINENAFTLDALHKSQNDLDLKQQQLEQYIADRESPGSLAAAAAKLGLANPGPPAFILLPDGKIIGVPRPATGPASNAGN